MALPTSADVVVVRGYWWDETTGQGVDGTVTFEPVPLGGTAKTTPNLRDLSASGFIKTRARVAAVDPTTGYFATLMVASNDPDLDAYGGRKVTFSGETPFTVQVPYNAPTTTVDAQMAAATGLLQGSSVKAVWLSDAALVTTPTPSPPVQYLTADQTLSNIVDTVDAHDTDPEAHQDIRALIGGGGGGSSLPEYTATAVTTTVAASSLAWKTTRFDTTTAAITQPLPAATTGTVLAVGWDAGTNALTLQRAGSDVIGSGSATTLTVPLVGEVLTLHCTTAGRWRIVSGFKPQNALDGRFAPGGTQWRSGTAPNTSSVLVKPSGEGSPALFDLMHDDATGYIFHLHAGSNTGDNTALIGIGTDQGAAAGLLISHKNNGAGLRITGNPHSGFATYITNYAVAAGLYLEAYAGSSGVVLASKTGQGYSDGVSTSGSTTFTSAEANFTSADVGAALSQLTSRGSTGPIGTIPNGTTIVSVTNSTTVVLSQAATATATGLMFRVSGRAVASSQHLLQVLDTDGTTELGAITRSGLVWSTPGRFTTNDTAQPALRVIGKSGQSTNLLQVESVSGTTVFSIQSTGRVRSSYAGLIDNAGNQGVDAFKVQNYGTGTTLMVQSGPSQATDQLTVIDSAYSVQSRFNKDGYFMTKKTTAPSDADVNPGEMALWLDSTTGAAKMMVKAKDNGGTVRTAAVALT